MDSTVIGEDMEMQVVVVTHNVLPIRSLRWQNIPSSLPVKSKVYSCGRVRHKRGQQNSSKCLDKELFYPYIPYVSLPCPSFHCLSSLYDTLHPSEAWLKKSGCTLKNDEDGEVIQSSLNEKVRSCTYQWWTAYAVALPPNTFRDIVDTDPDQCLFSNNRKGPWERETQPIPPSVHVKESFKGGLCERREEFNEVRGEHWSATGSVDSYLNAVLKSLFSTYNLGRAKLFN